MLIYSLMCMYLNKYKRFCVCLCGSLIFFSMTCLAEEKNKILPEPKMVSEPFQSVGQEGQTKSILIKLRHAEVEQVVKMLEKRQTGEGILSKEGHIAVDKTTNALWIFDLPERLNIIRRLIQQIDLPVKQVVLQAYIVNADQNFTRDIGIDFSEGQTGSEDPRQNLYRNIPRLALQKNRLNIAVTKLGPGVSLEMALTALENQGRGRILSSPRLVTSSGKAAYIGSGDEIPYQERTSHGNTSVAFKKAVLSLEVTPQWLPENTMILDLVVHQDKVSALLVNGVPAIHTQEVRTQVRVRDGQTIVLGGIFEYVRSEQLASIPGLGHLPLIGGLFRHKLNKLDRRELLIFITPRVVTSLK